MIHNAARRGLMRLPPRAEVLVRAVRNQRALAGFYAPGRELSALVPAGKLAIDAGANVGSYSYWIARAASQVVAFEPQPRLAKRLANSGIRGLTVHNCALSDTGGVAELYVPPPSHQGEASLRALEVSASAIEVPLATVDSFELSDVGFFKIDVEGHEEPLLHGAEATLRRSAATIYVEIEERHNRGGISRIATWLAELGYTDVKFRQHGAMHPIADFDLQRDQLEQRPRTAAYANNFLFRRPA